MEVLPQSLTDDALLSFYILDRSLESELMRERLLTKLGPPYVPIVVAEAVSLTMAMAPLLIINVASFLVG